MRKIKYLLFALLIVFLTGCSSIQMKWGHNIADYGEELPNVVMAVQDTQLLYDKECVQFNCYYGFNSDFKYNENSDIEFMGVLLLTSTPEDANLEFSKTQTDWNYIENKGRKITGCKISKEECFDEGMKINIQENGDILYPYFRPVFLPEDLIVSKSGIFAIQFREVLFSKSEQCYFTGDKVQVAIEYKVTTIGMIELSLAGNSF